MSRAFPNDIPKQIQKNTHWGARSAPPAPPKAGIVRVSIFGALINLTLPLNHLYICQVDLPSINVIVLINLP